MANIEPRWLIEARKHIGLTEIKGAKHNPEIVQFWRDIKRGGIKDDETPWCAAFVGAMLERVGIRSTRFESAKSYLDWGEKLDTPAYGCIVVFTRVGGGHVGFVVGRRANGDLLVLGGNQGMRLIFAHSQHQECLAIAGLLANHAIPLCYQSETQQPQLMRHEKSPGHAGASRFKSRSNHYRLYQPSINKLPGS